MTIKLRETISHQGAPSGEIATSPGDVYVNNNDLSGEVAPSVSHSNVSHPTYLPFTHYAPPKRTDTSDQHWVDSHTSKLDNSIRIWYSNPCGLGINPTGTKSHLCTNKAKQTSCVYLRLT